MTEPDAVVVGAGPNGLAAAVTLARAGLRVLVVERNAQPGGGARTMELTLPGFRHDVCSAVHPLALASEFFRGFELERRVGFAIPEASFGHPLDGGRAAVAYRSLRRTVDELGGDGRAYERLIGPLARRADAMAEFTGAPLLPAPRHPLAFARFGLASLDQGTPLWRRRFRDDAAPALLTGAMAHAIQRLPSLGTAGAGLSLAAYAHARGWPIPIGGSQAITDALVADLRAHGGSIETGLEIESLAELAGARAVLLDVTPRALLRLAGDGVPPGYRRALSRFRYGNGVAKADFALSSPAPWADERLRQAGTVHVGGTRAEIARAENDVALGRHPDSPFVLVSQPTVFDPSRAPAGAHTLWAYTHVPAGSRLDRTEHIVRQIERFAPGFRDTILAVAAMDAATVETHNPNYVGGDIGAGEASFAQLARRPVLSGQPWRTPLPGVYLCSASVAPGPGVHGMAGWRAALSALRHEFGVPEAPSLALA
ncbi:MAG: NAD(P)/FAD-dependent oxidoreductase [Microbacterium sp.]|uniref:phytoene desaturase family protein n=1 Tax=Microbacterium sp. TaxID=51671 RepID=UPI0039E55E04